MKFYCEDISISEKIEKLGYIWINKSLQQDEIDFELLRNADFLVINEVEDTEEDSAAAYAQVGFFVALRKPVYLVSSVDPVENKWYTCFKTEEDLLKFLNKKLKIFLISGPIKSGKDTCADYLISKKLIAGKIALAGPLKQICKNVFNLSSEQVYEQGPKEALFERPIKFDLLHLAEIIRLMNEYVCIVEPDTIVNSFKNMDSIFPFKFIQLARKHIDILGKEFRSPREILQYVGTEYIRNIVDPDWHLKAAFSEKNLKTLEINGIYCVTDVRFPNELEYLNKNFNTRSIYIHRDSAEEELNKSSHASELQLKNVRTFVDEVVFNNSSLEDFYELINKLKLN